MRNKKKAPVEITIKSYGLYEKWDNNNQAIPKCIMLTESIIAELGIEFGMVVEIDKSRGRYLDFRIDHPDFKDDNGKIEPPFTGSFRVKHTPYKFFLGDTIWAPIEDKRGEWKLTIIEEGKEIVSKTLLLI